MKYLLLILSFSQLVGCVGASLQNGLDSLIGRSENIAFNVMGYPNLAQEFGDRIVYTYSTRYSYSTQMPTITRTTGMIGSTPIMANSYGYQTQQNEAYCEIQLTSMNGVISSYNVSGNIIGCSRYSNLDFPDIPEELKRTGNVELVVRDDKQGEPIETSSEKR